MNKVFLCATIIVAFVAFSNAECPKAKCKMACPNGFEKDKDGCEVCKCKKPECPKVQCRMKCADGFEKNKKGCEICKCKTKKVCPARKCIFPGKKRRCRNGFEKDENGCKTCDCKCPHARCTKFCFRGYKRDEDGCRLCECKPVVCRKRKCTRSCKNGYKVNRYGCQTCYCNRCPPLCRMKCEKGFVRKNGCRICKCRE
ncbi:antistasin-like [Hydractinia symbiolongicarpus]|uniref:antistasin-like n=1 Tax=Hydractinia symbiolongicarpus TaxID=13093 RepID=UPI00254F6926|nr:antistasin-like [Hydractinia symbiolongicarpus]